MPRTETSSTTEVATLGGGCFWCLEAVFDELNGVERVESGYAGGTVPNPSYEAVCAETTGHAEVVQVTFDPQVISFKEILEVFFTTHDPTTLNRQGADVGTQYRSVIFCHTPEQRTIAAQVIQELTAAGIWKARIVTEVVPFTAFYRAEDYHQEFFQQNPGQLYCQFVISPKVAKFRKEFLTKLKP
ncbi:MAG: peptide-methionine (S)-S-oxide reductase MsrA [Candidatus Entotheonellia bacterium]